MMQPLVSVRVTAYNQERYIAQCLDGILMQQTDFPFEVIVGEDCSQDRTGEILQDYRQRFPDTVRILSSGENLGTAKNSLRVQQACLGMYHAMCDGDDYWIDPQKLQRQVDLLQAHPELSLCFHNALILNEASSATRLFYESPPGAILSFDDISRLAIPTGSMLARSAILATLPEWRLGIRYWGDLLFRLWSAHHGEVGYLDRIMSVYRVHQGGATALARATRSAAYEDQRFVLEHLDRETNYQHTASIQLQLARSAERHRIQKHPRAYYLTRPAKLLVRLRQYLRALQRYRTVKHFGDQRLP